MHFRRPKGYLIYSSICVGFCLCSLCLDSRWFHFNKTKIGKKEKKRKGKILLIENKRFVCFGSEWILIALLVSLIMFPCYWHLFFWLLFNFFKFFFTNLMLLYKFYQSMFFFFVFFPVPLFHFSERDMSFTHWHYGF